MTRVFVVLSLIASLVACAGKTNVIQSIELAPEQNLALGTPLSFIVKGVGVCPQMAIDWGDGRVDGLGAPYDLTARAPVSHTFAGWSGGKTVTAMSIDDACLGRANTRFTIPPTVNAIGFAQPPPTPSTRPCSIVPGALSTPLPMRTLVHLTTSPLTTGNDLIDFGCPFQGCRYNADGKVGSVAAAPFPFPGLKEYSLVLRVGNEVFQGGTDVRFTTTRSGALEFCLNDALTRNYGGGYVIRVEVDQLGPPPPP